jgi:hypothetical protein
MCRYQLECLAAVQHEMAKVLPLALPESKAISGNAWRLSAISSSTSPSLRTARNPFLPRDEAVSMLRPAPEDVSA